MLVIVKQHLVQIDRIDGPSECLAQILAAIRLEAGTHRFLASSSYGVSLETGYEVSLQGQREACLKTSTRLQERGQTCVMLCRADHT